MGIVQYPQKLANQIGIIGAIKYMTTTDNLATITTAGYLNNIDLAVFPIEKADTIAVRYSYDVNTGSSTFGMFTVTISNGTITLVQWANPGDVLLPVVSGDFAIFNGTSGQIKDSAQAASNASNGFVVTSPGSLTAGNFPTLADVKGSLATGLPPSATSQAYVVVSPGSLTVNQLPKFSDANGTVADSGILASNVMILNGTNTMAAGSSIVAAKANGTEAANAVTASGMSGVITTSSLTTAGGASYAITWTNTFISTSSVILLSRMGGTNTTQNFTMSATAGSGTSTLTIYNNTAATPLNGTILIGYTVL